MEREEKIEDLFRMHEAYAQRKADLIAGLESCLKTVDATRLAVFAVAESASARFKTYGYQAQAENFADAPKVWPRIRKHDQDDGGFFLEFSWEKPRLRRVQDRKNGAAPSAKAKTASKPLIYAYKTADGQIHYQQRFGKHVDMNPKTLTVQQRTFKGSDWVEKIGPTLENRLCALRKIEAELAATRRRIKKARDLLAGVTDFDAEEQCVK